MSERYGAAGSPDPSPGGPGTPAAWLAGLDRRRMVLILAGGIVGLTLLLAANVLEAPPAGTGTGAVGLPETGGLGMTAPDAVPPGEASLAAVEAALSAQVERLLGEVAGAGRVSAWVTLAGGVERVYARDLDESHRTTREVDAQGGQRQIDEVTSRSELAAAALQGDAPVVTVRAADIRGVLVVAEGAADPEVRLRLLRSVQAVLGVPAHRIQVVSGRDGG